MTGAPEWLSIDDDEEILWTGSPEMVSLVGTAVAGLLTVVVLIGLLILLFLPLTYFSRKHTDYVVTNKSLYVKTGILSTNIESVGADKIQNTEFSQSFWGKKFGYGSIDISTAGSSGAEISFDSVADARDVRETVSSLRKEGGTTGASGTSGSADAGASGESEANLSELVEELRAIRESLERVEERMESEG